MVGGTMISKDEDEEWIRRDVFHTCCTSQGKIWKMIIDSGCFENLMSIEMEQKLDLETVLHPNPYQVCGLRKSVVIEISKWCLISFSIGKTYKDEVWCNVFPTKECHLLLGRPWLYDRRHIYDGFRHIYSFKIKGEKIILDPLNPILDLKPFKKEGNALITHGECQQELEESKIEVALIKDDEIKEKIDTRVSPKLLLLHSLWKKIVQTTFVVLTSMSKQKLIWVCL